MTDYIQTKWRDGSAFNHNLTSDEYFYNQIFEAVKKNVSAGTLPQFSRKTSSMPVELSTGKIINDENLIALNRLLQAIITVLQFGFLAMSWRS